MVNITLNTIPGKIPVLKEYKRYLCYQTRPGKPVIEYTLGELKNLTPGWKKIMPGVTEGLQRLASLAEERQILYDVYSKDECEKDCQKQDVKLWFMRAEGTAKEPFIIINAGGGYESVCSLAEAFPVARHFNLMGYHVFCLNYRVGGTAVLPKALDDLAAGYRFITKHKELFGLKSNAYAVAGFSAGGNLTAVWGTAGRGYRSYGLPAPRALLALYPLFSRKLMYAGYDAAIEDIMFGSENTAEEYRDSYETAGQIDRNYPPCFLMHCIDDDVVPVVNTVLYNKLLKQAGVRSEMELHLYGGHGFGDGENTDAKGWPERAATFLEQQK